MSEIKYKKVFQGYDNGFRGYDLGCRGYVYEAMSKGICLRLSSRRYVQGYDHGFRGYDHGCRWYDHGVGGMTMDVGYDHGCSGMPMRVCPKEYVRDKVQEGIPGI